MSKVLLITNIPAPYRVDLFYYMQTHQQTHEFFVIYTNRNEDNRQWVIDERKLLQSTILESKIIKRKGEGDVHYLHIPQHLTREITRINPDVVIAWEYNPSALKALLWCKRHGRKFIHLTDGTLRSERNIGRVQKLMRHIIIRHADACIASSTKAKEKLLHWGVPQRKIFLSLLTVDISRFRYAEKRENQHTLLFVGRIIPLKGLDLLLRALPKLHQPFELLIVGDGEAEEKAKLMAMAEETHVAQHIRWLGFQSGEPLAEGCSPTHSMDTHGPTSVFKSVSKLRTQKIAGGVLLNQKVNPQMLAEPKDCKKLSFLLRTFFDTLHGFHVQYNVVSRETLLDAQKHPQNYRDLIVRVAGYSAFFTVLSPQTQNDIIARTEQIL